MKGEYQSNVVSRVLTVVIVLSMLLSVSTVFTGQAIGETGPGEYIVSGEIKDSYEILVPSALVIATDMTIDSVLTIEAVNGSYAIDLSDISAQPGDTINIIATDGTNAAEENFVLSSGPTIIDFTLTSTELTPPTPSLPETGLDLEPPEIGPPLLPGEGFDEELLPPGPSLIISPDEVVMPPMPYAPGEKPKMVYNVTVDGLWIEDGVAVYNQNEKINIRLKNIGNVTAYIVTVDVAIISSEGERFLETLHYGGFQPEMSKIREVNWKPEVTDDCGLTPS